MALIKILLYSSTIVLFSWSLSLFLGDQGICSPSFPLDREAAFCIYYKMSGEDMKEQDLEELCSSLGRPTFSAYKPSEMFMKNTLRRLRHKLMQRMKKYSKDSIFKWDFKCILMPNKSKINNCKSNFLNKKMPQPTPFISSKITKIGQRAVNKLLNSLISKSLSKTKERSLKIILYLKPERIDYRNKKRNIAHEHVRLPFRCVIFHPVKMEVFPFKDPGQMLLSRNIPKRTTIQETKVKISN